MSAAAVETPARIELPGGALDYTLRRSARARRLRVVVDPRRGVVVTVPAVRRASASRMNTAVEAFLHEREGWLRRHLGRQAEARGRAVADGELTTGSVILFRGEPHRVRVETGPPSLRRPAISREGAADIDEIVIRVAGRQRPLAALLRAWLMERARVAIDREVSRHALALGVAPAAVSLRDPRTRWGSATRTGRLSFSWRLVLAPPEALETVVVHELAHLRVFGHGPDFWAVVASRRPDHRAWRRWLRAHSVELHATLV